MTMNILTDLFKQILVAFAKELDANTAKKQKVRYQTHTYRTKDGEAFFVFSFHLTNNGYEIDIHRQPSYGTRNDGSHTAHWLFSRRDADRKICVSADRYPQTIEDAKKLCIGWAELTWEYIKTGISLDAQIAMNHKK